MTPEQRTQRARIAAYSRWARPYAREEQAEAMRAYNLRRLEDRVDPGRVLPEHERARLVQAAAKAHSARMHLARSRRLEGHA